MAGGQTALFICFGLLLSSTAYAQSGIVFGTNCSPKSVGFTLTVDDGSKAFSEICLRADMSEVVAGNETFPGVTASYSYNYLINQWIVNEELALRLYSGPGCLAGYGNDMFRDWGMIAGVTGNIGLTMIFKKPVRINFSLSPCLGFHLELDGIFDNKLNYYRNGLVKAFYPEISILYSFK